MSLEMNKIAASVLTAGVVAMGAGFVANILVHPHTPEELAYKVAVKDGGASSEGAQEPSGPETILPLLADADVEAGKQATRACQACHSFEKGGANKVGPHLYNVVGRDIASAEGFSYSDALSGKEGKWTYETLNHFLHDPQTWASGTKMSYPGVKDTQKRADVIAWLRQNNDNPPPLPSEEEIAAATKSATESGDAAEGGGDEQAANAEGGEKAAANGDGGSGGDAVLQKIADADPATGKQATRVCQACHSFEKDGPNKVGPHLYDVVGRKIASVDSFSYSDALSGKDGKWTYETLYTYLKDPQSWAPGTRMTFPGVKDDAKRAAVIAYLRQQSDNPPPIE